MVNCIPRQRQPLNQRGPRKVRSLLWLSVSIDGSGRWQRGGVVSSGSRISFSSRRFRRLIRLSGMGTNWRPTFVRSPNSGDLVQNSKYRSTLSYKLRCPTYAAFPLFPDFVGLARRTLALFHVLVEHCSH